MSGDSTKSLTTRTTLEYLIRSRQQTFAEFVEYAEVFAREHSEPGTLSLRNLQRLAAGRPGRGTSAFPTVQPTTARLLERIFGMGIGDLLAPPRSTAIDRRQPVALRVAVAVVHHASQVLLVCRREPDASGLQWQFPAGVVKPGASVESVAVRETFAETGVHCRAVETLGTRLHPFTNVVCDYVLCEYVTGDIRNGDVVENLDAAWVDIPDVTRLVPAERIYPPIRDALRLT